MARDREKQNRYSRESKARLRISEPHRVHTTRAWALANPEKHLFRRMYVNCLKRKGRLLTRTITFEQFLAEIGGKLPELCPILGIPMTLDAPAKSDCIPTVDRIDSSRPYEAGNVAVISWRANIIKNMGTANEHRRIAEWMDRQKGDPSV